VAGLGVGMRFLVRAHAPASVAEGRALAHPDRPDVLQREYIPARR
jgi:hypothetical protein